MPRHEKKVEDNSAQIQAAQRLQKTADALLESGDSKSASKKYADALKAVEGLNDDGALDIRFSCGLGIAQSGTTRKKKSKSTRRFPARSDSAPPTPKDGTGISPENASQGNTERRASKSPSRPITSPTIQVFGKFMIPTGHPGQPQADNLSIAPYKINSRPASVLSNPIPQAVSIPRGGEPNPPPIGSSLASKIKEEKMQRARIPAVTPGPKTAIRNQRLSPTKSWGTAPQPLRDCQMKEDYVTELLRLEEDRKKREKEKEMAKRGLELGPDGRWEAPPIILPGEAPPAQRKEVMYRPGAISPGLSPPALRVRLPTYRQGRDVTSLPMVPSLLLDQTMFHDAERMFSFAGANKKP